MVDLIAGYERQGVEGWPQRGQGVHHAAAVAGDSRELLVAHEIAGDGEMLGPQSAVGLHHLVVLSDPVGEPGHMQHVGERPHAAAELFTRGSRLWAKGSSANQSCRPSNTGSAAA